MTAAVKTLAERWEHYAADTFEGRTDEEFCDYARECMRDAFYAGAESMMGAHQEIAEACAANAPAGSRLLRKLVDEINAFELKALPDVPVSVDPSKRTTH
jgi:hypothetical protein